MYPSLLPARFSRRPWEEESFSSFPIIPTTGSDPLAVLAETDPSAAAGLMHRNIDQEERRIDLAKTMGRLQVTRDISSDHTNQITEFIRAACANGSRNVSAEVVTEGVADEERFWSNRGERVAMKTTFRGCSW